MFPLPSELEALSRSYRFYDFSTGIHTLITQSCSRTRLLSKVFFFLFLKQPDDARLLYDNAFSVSKPDFWPRVQYLSATGPAEAWRGGSLNQSRRLGTRSYRRLLSHPSPPRRLAGAAAQINFPCEFGKQVSLSCIFIKMGIEETKHMAGSGFFLNAFLREHYIFCFSKLKYPIFVYEY